jgi:uncharacterized protein with NRDE domain
MCLVVVAYQAHPEYPLVVAANRDEFHDRPTAPAGWWDDAPDVLAGRDLRSGGTWMGITRGARFAAITNHRDFRVPSGGSLSRGALVADFLVGDESTEAYLSRIAPAADVFDGFHLLVGAPGELWYFSNRSGRPPRALAPGLYGLSNAVLDTPWRKVLRGKQALAEELAAGPRPEALLEHLADRTLAAEHDLPDTGAGQEMERVLSAIHIEAGGYGTVSSSALLVAHTGEIRFVERSAAPAPTVPAERRFSFRAGN